ncbi:MAG: response regulator transcription factor [Maricaulaceae bacterium]
MTSKILIVDDHPLAQQGIKSVIESLPEFTVCGILDRASAVLPFIKTQLPDIILLDLNLPDRNGLDILAELVGAFDLTIIILTGEANAKKINRCLNLGVRGIVSKGDKSQNIVDAMRQALVGDIYLSPDIISITRAAKQSKIDLSPRQMAILHFLSDDITNKEISYRLKIAAPTVSFHIGEIRKKLNVSNNKKILSRAKELDLI